MPDSHGDAQLDLELTGLIAKLALEHRDWVIEDFARYLLATERFSAHRINRFNRAILAAISYAEFLEHEKRNT